MYALHIYINITYTLHKFKMACLIKEQCNIQEIVLATIIIIMHYKYIYAIFTIKIISYVILHNILRNVQLNLATVIVQLVLCSQMLPANVTFRLTRD